MYMPALLRAYPFGTGRVDGNAAQTVLSIDIGWAGLSHTDGVPLFEADGSPSAHLQAMQQAARAAGSRGAAHARAEPAAASSTELLREMRFDADLPDGQKLQVDGFLTVDEKKLAALPDADVLAMQRSGVLGLIYAHFVSLGNMRKLVHWRLERAAAAPTPAAA